MNANEQQLQHGSPEKAASSPRQESQFYQDMYQASAQGEKEVFVKRTNNKIYQ